MLNVKGFIAGKINFFLIDAGYFTATSLSAPAAINDVVNVYG
jgi:hypothetical protein